MKTRFFILVTLSMFFAATTSFAQRISVLEFNAGAGISQADVEGISAIFNTYFTPAGYTLVERTQIDRVIDEQNFQRGSITQSQMVRIGQMTSTSTYNQQSGGYEIGDYYDVGGKQGVVFTVTPDGQHGKIVCLQDLGEADWYDAKSICANLGSGWRLPTEAELLAIYEVMGQLNSMLIALGDPIQEDCWYWLSTEYNEFCACCVDMTDGYTYRSTKYGSYYVRAVSAF